MKKYLFLLPLLLCLLSVTVMAGDYVESPVLTKKVEKGELAPIEERLPDNPFVIDSGVLIEEKNLDWQPGEFGGTLTTTHVTPEWNPYLFMMMNEGLLSSPGIGVSDIKGNIVKDFEVSDDNQVFTFTLRKGLKWSDGHPVTTEDIKFTYEDVLQNEKLTPTFPAKYRSGGKVNGTPMKLEVIDDYTFKYIFDEPYGGFLREITIKGWTGYPELLKPKHHMKQFHIKYTSMDKLKPYLEEEELNDEWWEIFHLNDAMNWDLTRDVAIDFPVLYPWVRVESPGGLLGFERNPYYFKVDAEGQQLPYIDEVKSFEVNETEMMTMKVITGEVDFLGGGGMVKMPLYREHADKGGYEVNMLNNHVDPVVFFLNYNYNDPVWQEVVNNLKFRKALNLSIDRQEIIDTLYYGFAEKPDTIPAEYNVEKARQLLDEMGMDKRDKDGWRLGPDGETFEIFIELADREQAPAQIPATELLVEYFKEIGINASMKIISAELQGQRAAANDLTATVLWISQPQWRDGIWSDYLPNNFWGPEWQLWYNTGGEEGTEPPADIKKLYELYETTVAAIPFSEADQNAINEIYDYYNDNIPFIIIVEETIDPTITGVNVGNVPHAGFALGAVTSGEQFFYEE